MVCEHGDMPYLWSLITLSMGVLKEKSLICTKGICHTSIHGHVASHLLPLDRHTCTHVLAQQMADTLPTLSWKLPDTLLTLSQYLVSCCYHMWSSLLKFQLIHSWLLCQQHSSMSNTFFSASFCFSSWLCCRSNITLHLLMLVQTSS